MKFVIIILSILVLNVNSVVKAALEIISYDPLTFRLIFSQNLTLPFFQILVDSNPLPYRVLNSQISSTYRIEVTQNYEAYDSLNTEAFSLVFNYPLDVANGQLYINNFIIQPPKTDLYINMETWVVHLIFSMLIICSIFGILSLAVIDFIQIYILTEIKSHNHTSVIETYSALFFFDQPQLSSGQIYLFRLIRPTIILIGVFIFGNLVKYFSKFIKNHFLRKRIIKFLSYNLFLTAWTIFLPSIIYKAFQFLDDVTKHKQDMTTPQYVVGIIFTYLNFVHFFTYLYVVYFVLNPRYKQDFKDFKKYMLSPEFQLYNKFHRGLHLKDWIKRNTVFFITVRKLIILMLFFVSNNIAPFVLGLQLVGSFFMFTVRPYKEWFYRNLVIIFNILWFFFYILVLEGFFYFYISNTLETRNSLSKFLVSKTIIFHIICFLGLVASVVQGIRLFKNLKYDFKTEKQVKENYTPLETTRDRVETDSSDKPRNLMKDSLTFQDPNSPQLKRKKRQPSSSSNAKNRMSLFEIQMEDLSPSFTNGKFSTRIKKKWKDKSLLEQLASN